MSIFFETGVGLGRAIRFSLWGVTILVWTAWGSALVAAERELEGADPLYSGVYVSDHGSQITVYAPSNSTDVIMDYTSTVESPMVLYLRGDKSNLVPYSVRSTANMNNRPVQVLFDQDAILAGAGGSQGASYVQHKSKGFVSRGAPDESGQMEAELMLKDYGDLWARLRRVSVRLTPETLEIRNSEKAPLPNAVFKRQGALGNDARKTFQAAVLARDAGLADIEDLVKPSK